jgi:pseudaminic acid cytidylyltransferase
VKIAVIPARGGSKRIPRKNVLPFCGLAIMGYSIAAARAAGVFDHIIVSTDDEEIAAVARALGAQTPFVRPAELANDHATTVPVIAHAVQWVQENLSPVTHACCIYATAPFVQADSIRAAHHMLVEEQVTGYVFSATSFPFPIQRAFQLDDSGHVRMFWPENYNARSQDLPQAYQDAGQFYWGTAEAFLSRKIFFATDSRALVLPRYLVQDIDTPQDWRRAELMYQALLASGEISAPAGTTQ